MSGIEGLRQMSPQKAEGDEGIEQEIVTESAILEAKVADLRELVDRIVEGDPSPDRLSPLWRALEEAKATAQRALAGAGVGAAASIMMGTLNSGVNPENLQTVAGYAALTAAISTLVYLASRAGGMSRSGLRGQVREMERNYMDEG